MRGEARSDAVHLVERGGFGVLFEVGWAWVDFCVGFWREEVRDCLFWMDAQWAE